MCLFLSCPYFGTTYFWGIYYLFPSFILKIEWFSSLLEISVHFTVKTPLFSTISSIYSCFWDSITAALALASAAACFICEKQFAIESGFVDIGLKVNGYKYVVVNFWRVSMLIMVNIGVLFIWFSCSLVRFSFILIKK